MRFTDKVCIVTGGASGIGRAVCRQLASEGGNVVVVDINEEGGLETVRQIRDYQGEAIFVKADIASAEDVRNVVSLTLARWHRIDVLVNNAAIMIFKRVVDLDEEEWDRVINVNLRSCFLFCKYCIPHMKQGAIVNVSSVHAHQTEAMAAPYATSKGGMEAFTRALSREYDPAEIRVNCVVPGGTDTPMLWTNPGIKAMNPRDVIAAAPEQVAAVVCFLASKEAQTIHGSAIVADMGLLAKL